MKKRMMTTAMLLFVLGISASAGAADWATLKGQFLYGKENATVPTSIKLVPTKDVEVCGKNQLYDESLVVNPENRGVSGIILWVFRPKSVHPDYAKTENSEVMLDNLGCRFEPHVQTLRTTQKLVITNSDPVPVNHNSMITFFKNDEVNPMIPPGGKVEFTFPKAESFPATVSCSIHPWMKGIVLVQDHPYMAVTDKDGNFELKNLPAGKLSIKVWHEKAGWVKDVLVDGKKTKLSRGRYSITMKAGKDEEHKYVLDPSFFSG
jgi:hypothetical protein